MNPKQKNNSIKKMYEKRRELEYKMLEYILPEELIDDDGNAEIFTMDYFYGSVWIKRDNTIYAGDEFDIKDFIEDSSKDEDLFIFNITHINNIDGISYAIEKDGDFYTIYVLYDDLLYDETYDDRKSASWEKFIENIK